MAQGYEWLHPMSESVPSRLDKYIVWAIPVGLAIMYFADWLLRRSL